MEKKPLLIEKKPLLHGKIAVIKFVRDYSLLDLAKTKSIVELWGRYININPDFDVYYFKDLILLGKMVFRVTSEQWAFVGNEFFVQTPIDSCVIDDISV